MRRRAILIILTCVNAYFVGRNLVLNKPTWLIAINMLGMLCGGLALIFRGDSHD